METWRIEFMCDLRRGAKLLSRVMGFCWLLEQRKLRGLVLSQTCLELSKQNANKTWRTSSKINLQ